MRTFDVSKLDDRGRPQSGGKVSLNLPDKGAKPTPDNATAIEQSLTSVTAYHAMALTTYTYYEVVDAWLGPWGKTGYPIGYGKYYNILFSTDNVLMHNSQARKWVKETSVKLQEALTSFVLKRFKAGKLGTLSEQELRLAAFESHSKCYTDGGLAWVAVLDPALLPIIASIPGKEFDPRSPDFGPTVRQVFETVAQVGYTATAVGMASIMPAHSGFLRRAAARDMRRYQDAVTLGHRLGRVKQAIEAGKVDHLPWLDQIIRELTRTKFQEQQGADFARSVVLSARNRQILIRKRYRRLLDDAPAEVKHKIDN